MNMSNRLKEFNIILDDVSIVSLTYGRDYQRAIELKTVAAQDAEKAKFAVERAIQ
jgi:prohibitin 2